MFFHLPHSHIHTSFLTHSRSILFLFFIPSHSTLAHFMVAAFHSAFPSPNFHWGKISFHFSLLFLFFRFLKRVFLSTHGSFQANSSLVFDSLTLSEDFRGKKVTNFTFSSHLFAFRLSLFLPFHIHHSFFHRWKIIFITFHKFSLTIFHSFSLFTRSHSLEGNFHWRKLNFSLFSFCLKQKKKSLSICVYVHLHIYPILWTTFSLNTEIMDGHKNFFCQWTFFSLSFVIYCCQFRLWLLWGQLLISKTTVPLPYLVMSSKFWDSSLFTNFCMKVHSFSLYLQQLSVSLSSQPTVSHHYSSSGACHRRQFLKIFLWMKNTWIA